MQNIVLLNSTDHGYSMNKKYGINKIHTGIYFDWCKYDHTVLMPSMN